MDSELTKDILTEYGFKVLESKSKNRVTVFSKNKVEIVITDGGDAYYSNMGFDYPLTTLQDLKKLYKELRREDLVK